MSNHVESFCQQVKNMNYKINLQTYLKLAKLTETVDPRFSKEQSDECRHVRIENSAGKQFALSSNRTVMSVYFLGKTDQQDGFCHLTVDPFVVSTLKALPLHETVLDIMTIPSMNIATISVNGVTMFADGVATFPADHIMTNWKTWVERSTPKETIGAMAWKMHNMVALSETSPSGFVAFPEFIDATKSIVIRDINDENWYGVFMGNRVDDENRAYTTEPAYLPKWVFE